MNTFLTTPRQLPAPIKGKVPFYFWRLYCCSHNAPGGFCLIAFVGRVTNTSPHLLPPVAPPETTAGGGVASSAPHPVTLYPFQASTCPEMCPGILTPPSQCARGTPEPEVWDGWDTRSGNFLLLWRSCSRQVTCLSCPVTPGQSQEAQGGLYEKQGPEGRRSGQPITALLPEAILVFI